MYVPAHDAVSVSGYADAAAKSSLGLPEVDDVTALVTQLVEARPYAAARKSARGYVRGRLSEGLAVGRTTAGVEGIWAEATTACAARIKPDVLACDREARKAELEDVELHNERLAFTMGMRADDLSSRPPRFAAAGKPRSSSGSTRRSSPPSSPRRSTFAATV